MSTLTAALLAGCASGGKPEVSSPDPKPGESANAVQPAPGASAEPVKIEIALESYGVTPPKDDFVKKALDEKLGTDITLALEATDFANKINVRVAGGNYPDVMLITKQQAEQFAKSGILLDMSPYLDKLPDYVSFVGGPDALKKGQVDGKQVSLPKAPTLPINTFWIRKDWLDRLHLKPPETIDELLAVAKAFTDGDPDGNNKKDTLGLSGYEFDTFSGIFGAYGVTSATANNQFLLRDGKLINPLTDPAMKQALAKIREFIEAGVVDPEILNKINPTDKAFQGKVGIVYYGWSSMIKDEFVKVWKGANPNAEWIQLPALKGPTGLAFAGSVDKGNPGNQIAIPKTVEKQPEKLNKILQLLNYISTEEGNRLVQFGLKDVHYTVDNGKPKITEKGTAESGYTFLYQITGRPEKEYMVTKFPGQAPYIDLEMNLPRLTTLDGFVQPSPGYNKADANRFIAEELTKIIFGKAPLEQYDAFIDKLNGTFHFDKYWESGAKQLQSLGLVK